MAKFIANKLLTTRWGLLSCSYKMRTVPPCFSHSRALRLARSRLLSSYSYFYRFLPLFDMSDDDREASGEKWVEARSWSHVDLLEFIRPAFWAMLAFMLIPRWWDNTELTLATLNGQALYMVCLLSFYFYFVF